MRPPRRQQTRCIHSGERCPSLATAAARPSYPPHGCRWHWTACSRDPESSADPAGPWRWTGAWWLWLCLPPPHPPPSPSSWDLLPTPVVSESRKWQMVLLFSSKIGKNKLDISFEYIQMMSSARGSPGTLSSAPLRLRVSVDGFRLSRKQKRAPWCPGAAAAGAVIIAVVCSRWRPGESRCPRQTTASVRGAPNQCQRPVDTACDPPVACACRAEARLGPSEGAPWHPWYPQSRAEQKMLPVFGRASDAACIDKNGFFCLISCCGHLSGQCLLFIFFF